MKLHQKGFLLITICKSGGIWDQQLINKVFAEYDESGDFREKSIRITLDELAAAGLVKRTDNKLEIINGKTKLIFKYQISDFGITRMVDTGLLLP
jgi:hypothetical protein